MVVFIEFWLTCIADVSLNFTNMMFIFISVGFVIHVLFTGLLDMTQYWDYAVIMVHSYLRVCV